MSRWFYLVSLLLSVAILARADAHQALPNSQPEVASSRVSADPAFKAENRASESLSMLQAADCVPSLDVLLVVARPCPDGKNLSCDDLSSPLRFPNLFSSGVKLQL